MEDTKYFILTIIRLFLFLLVSTISHCKYLNDPNCVFTGKVERIGMFFFEDFIEFKTEEIDYKTEEKMYADITPYSSMYKIKVGESVKIRYITNSNGCISRYVVCPSIKDAVINFMIFYTLMTVPLSLICLSESKKEV